MFGTLTAQMAASGGAPPPPPALVWTARGNPVGGEQILSIGVDNVGNALLIDDLGNVYKSTNGGHTWVLLTTLAGGANAGGTLNFTSFGGGAGVWIFAQSGNSIYRSTNGGASWTSIFPVITSGGVAYAQTDGAGNWVLVSSGAPGPFNYAISTDNGATWSVPGLTANGGCQGPILWDAANNQFVAILFSGGDTVIATKTATGTAWTLSAATVGLHTIDKLGSTYFSISEAGPGATYRHATTLAALQAGADSTVPGLNSLEVVLIGGGKFVVLDINNDTAQSSDAAVWSAISFDQMAPLEGINQNASFYDATHSSFIIGGDGGDVSTSP